MKLFYLMSWRNLWRHKRRSLVVISSIALGIFSMIFSMGIMNGFNIQMVENTISTSLGHIAIHRKGFQDNMKPEYYFAPEKRIITAVKNTGNIRAYAPRVKAQAMIKSSETSRGVLIVGIDPAMEKTVSKLYEYTSREDGSAFLGSVNKGEIMLSKAMMKILKIEIGDKIVLMIQDKYNEIKGVGFKVVGVYQTPMDSFDKYMVFVGIKDLQDITGIGNNLSEITIITKDKDMVDSIARILIANIAESGSTSEASSSQGSRGAANSGGVNVVPGSPKRAIAGQPGNGLEVLTWKQMAPNLVSAVKLYDQMIYIFFLIIFITIVFSIANTLIMAIMERFHEIGVMKCIGTRPLHIFSMIIFEALNLGMVGLVAGLAAGLVVVWALSRNGLDFSVYIESMRMWGSGSIIYPAIRLVDIVKSASVVFATTLIAALYPAIKAARIKPLEALHYV